MSEYNFGIIKATFTNYLNESEDVVARDLFKKFMQLIKESAILKAEFEVYKNLEDKYQPNDVLAMKYIEDNISTLASKSNKDHYINEHKKLKPVFEGIKEKVSPTKKELYENIHTLIFESLPAKESKDVNKVHASLCFVMEHIKNNKPKLVESTEEEYDNVPKDFLIRKAIEKFNNKFSTLNEDDKLLFKTIISEDSKIKTEYFENLKSNILSTWSEYDKVDDSINRAVEKLNKMTFNESTYIKDVLTLKELNEDLT